MMVGRRVLLAFFIARKNTLNENKAKAHALGAGRRGRKTGDPV